MILNFVLVHLHLIMLFIPIHETMCFKHVPHVLCANPCPSNFVVDPNHKKMCFILIYDFFVLFPLLLVHMHMFLML